MLLIFNITIYRGKKFHGVDLSHAIHGYSLFVGGQLRQFLFNIIHDKTIPHITNLISREKTTLWNCDSLAP